MKTLIIFAFIFTLAASQCQAKYVGSGSYTYTDDTGKPIQITYVEDDEGVRVTSHNLSPEEEKKVVEQIKGQNLQMQQQLNQQLTQLNQQLSQQFSHFGQQFAGFQPQPFYPFFGYSAVPFVPNYNTFAAFPFYNPNYPFNKNPNFPF